MLHRRKRLPAPKRRESLWKTRRTTIRYLLYFLMGLLLGSIAAVLCGADLVLELPVTDALSSAEGFADGVLQKIAETPQQAPKKGKRKRSGAAWASRSPAGSVWPVMRRTLPPFFT